MNIENTFKNLILANFLSVLLIGVSVFFESEEISKISNNLGFGVLGSIGSDWIIATILIGLSLIYLTNLILLYRFVYFAKTLFLILFILGILVVLTTGPVVLEPLMGTLDTLNTAIEGAILVFLYFTPIKDKFVK